METTLYKGVGGNLFESQNDSFRCGPVSIVNAIRYTKPEFITGRATRRTICVKCDAQIIHKDGFMGTKPYNITSSIAKIWPKYIYATGVIESVKLILNPSYHVFIMLYADKHASGDQQGEYYYHYVMMYRKNNYFYIQNDNSTKETRVSISTMKTKFMNETMYPSSFADAPEYNPKTAISEVTSCFPPHFNYRLPQIWAL